MGLTALDGIDSTLKIGFERFRCLEGLKRSGVSGDFDTPTKKVGLESNSFRCVECFKGFEGVENFRGFEGFKGLTGFEGI